MRKLERDKEYMEKNLPSIFYGVGREHYEYKLHEVVLKKKQIPIPYKYWKDNFFENSTRIWEKANPTLMNDSNNKCAYCERKFDGLVYNLEHYRPRKDYYWLAYSYLNYLPSCEDCNFEKLNKFPIKVKNRKVAPPFPLREINLELINQRGGQNTEEPILPEKDRFKYSKRTTIKLKREKPLLINPYLDFPAKYLAYQVIEKNQEVIIVPRSFLKGRRERANSTIKGIVNLNRPELKTDRYIKLLKFREKLADAKAVPSRSERKKQVQALFQEYSEASTVYSGMYRYFSKNRRKLPSIRRT